MFLIFSEGNSGSMGMGKWLWKQMFLQPKLVKVKQERNIILKIIVQETNDKD